MSSLTTCPAKILPISRITKVSGRIKKLSTSSTATEKEKAEERFRVQNIIKKKQAKTSKKNKIRKKKKSSSLTN